MTAPTSRNKQLSSEGRNHPGRAKHYDVAIVGARCAGSALALMLAREGLRVLVIDRTTFPSDTMSGHFIQPAGVAMLRRIGLGEELARLGYPAQETMTVDFGAAVVSGRPAPMPDGTDIGFAPRRFRFDPMLAEAAVQAGAELREATNFVALLYQGEDVCGLSTTGPTGKESVYASLVVGADGKRSRVARSVGAVQYELYPALTCAYYTYWEGADVPSTRLTVRDGLFAVAVPCGNGLTFLAVQWPHARFHQIRADIDGNTRRAIAAVPWLAERFAAARPVERFIGTGDLDTFFRTAHGRGWALVGDAGNHKDPITAQGMTDALLDAEVLARCIADGLGGARDPAHALADYAAARDRRSLPMHRVTLDLARLAQPPAEAQAELARLAEDPEAVGRFLGAMAGSAQPEQPPASRTAEAAQASPSRGVVPGEFCPASY